jgi:membrane protein YdbS with pleckstrin-like domain
MQEFEDIKSLWHNHTVEVKISSGEMLQQAKKEVKSIRNKSLLNIIGMGLSFVAVACLWLFFDFNSWTTHAGITILITAIAIYTFILYRGHRLISETDFTANPNDFLSELRVYQISRYILYNRLFWIYMIALCVGSALFFFEVLSYFSFWKQVLVVMLSLGWFIFCSTILRSIVIKKEKERIALLIEKFERISAQFKEKTHNP